MNCIGQQTVTMNDVCRNLCSKKTDEEDEEEDTHQSKLEVHFFSFTTFYYLVSSHHSAPSFTNSSRECDSLFLCIAFLSLSKFILF